jgi:hypothetical protein
MGRRLVVSQLLAGSIPVILPSFALAKVCGRNSAVECLPSKQNVACSNHVGRFSPNWEKECKSIRGWYIGCASVSKTEDVGSIPAPRVLKFIA